MNGVSLTGWPSTGPGSLQCLIAGIQAGLDGLVMSRTMQAFADDMIWSYHGFLNDATIMGTIRKSRHVP
jgi:hypothetical protein